MPLHRPLPLAALLLALSASAVAREPVAPLAPPPPGAASAPDIRVQLSASRHTVLSAELAGKITRLDVKEGERFDKGQRLVEFDCAIHKARLNHSAAAESAAGKKLDVAKRLDQLQSISLADVAQAQADLAMARAESGVGRVMVQRCAIAAPFAGRVSERKVQPGQYVAEGEELLALYDDGAYEVEMIVPSRWLAWLAPGQAFEVDLDETGQRYPAHVIRLGAVVDPLSQSVKVFGRITASDNQLLPGMSGTARLAPPAAEGTAP